MVVGGVGGGSDFVVGVVAGGGVRVVVGGGSELKGAFEGLEGWGRGVG